MRYATLFLLLLCTMPSCSTIESVTNPQELLAHRIFIPKHYAWGKSNPFLDSSLDQYVRSYDQAWWSYIEDLSHNIEDHRTADIRMGRSWPSDPSAVAGFRDGFAAAEARVHSLIARLGKERTEEVLKQTIEEILKQKEAGVQN